jgi:biotin synthase
MDKAAILNWLREEDERCLDKLWRMADATRQRNVGDAVHLRGLVEISNYCVRECAYCGIRAGRVGLQRYRMTADEVMDCVAKAVAYGYGTVVLQAGEDYGLTREGVAGVVRRIRSETPLAVTLSLGERPDADLEAWREAGADRYLLRFETSSRALYERIHPPLAKQRSDRVSILRRLRHLGYAVGSGILIGIPGQTWGDVTNDILLFRELDLDMTGVGPWLSHPVTPLGLGAFPPAPPGEQVPNSEGVTYKVIALARLACPRANIPSTTALATINTETGRELGLSRGANVVMPNLTPPKYRVLYEIYPGKACLYETAEACDACIKGRIIALGRRVGVGRGDAPRRALGKDTVREAAVPAAAKCHE